MKKIISFLLLAAMLIGCMVPAVVVSAADATLTAEPVEKMQGTGANVSPKITLANNPGIYSLRLVVYYDSAKLAQADADSPFANSIFSADDSTIGSELRGNHKNLKNYVPDELESSSNGFIVDLCGAYDDDLGDTLVVTDDGIAIELPLSIKSEELGTFNYNVVVEAADVDGNEIEIADFAGTVSYVADPYMGIYDDFTVFSVPADGDIEIGTESIDVDVRIDNNPGIWAARFTVVYPECLKLNDGTGVPKIENSYMIFPNANDLFLGDADIDLDSEPSNIPSNIKELMSTYHFETNGYLATTVYFELPGTDDYVEANGILATLHFDIADDVVAGQNIDIRYYYDKTADFLWAGTDPDTKEPIFRTYQPEVIGADFTVVEKICAHTNTTEQTEEATCGADGSVKVVCSDCGATISVTPIPATGNHTEGEAVIVPSTCTEAGTSTVYCTVCDKVLSETALDLAAHTPGAEPTCQAAQTCTVCGVELKSALEHVEGAPAVTNPTCVEDGKSVYSCTMCGEFMREEPILATGHVYLQPQNSVVTPPTCTEDGYTTRYCDVCNEPKITDPTPAWGHDEDGDVVTVDSTCTVAGTKTIYCDTCGEISKVEELPLAAHAIVEVPAYGPFCHADGVAAHWACEVCGKLFADEEATQEVDVAVLVIEAENELVYVPGAEACHVPGIAEYWYCPECDCVYADEAGTQLTNRKNLEIAPDCELVHMEKVEACHANGTEEYWFCPECEAVYADEAGTQLTNRMNLTIPADSEAVHTPAVDATCTENGMAEYWYCADCDTHFADAECKYPVAYLSLTIPATGHDYVDGECTVCGDKEAADEDTDDNKAPTTGDNMIVIVVALAVALMAGAALIVIRRKRSSN